MPPANNAARRRQPHLLRPAEVLGCFYLFTDYAPIIRYAEVLLNQAAAPARTGNDATDLALLNAVRNRSVAAADQYANSVLTGTNLVRAVLNERRIEFIGEGFRWSDIARLSPQAAQAPVTGGGILAKFNSQLSDQVVLSKYVCGAWATGQPIAAIHCSYDLFLTLKPRPVIALVKALNIR